jgi:RHS repeat-associated protein
MTCVAESEIPRAGDELAAPGVASVSYVDGGNVRGNVTNDGTRAMTYDAQDRMIELVMGNLTEKYQYDYFGRRTVKAVYTAGQPSPVTWSYVYDGNRLIGEYVEYPADTAPTLARTYVWGTDQGNLGSLLSVTDYLAAGGAKTYLPACDGSGDVVALMRGDGVGGTDAAAASYRYDPYGMVLESFSSPQAPNAAEACPFRFQEMYYDSETGLYWGGAENGSRYYNPNLQRWLSRNPAGESADVNLYRIKLVQETRWPAGGPMKEYDPHVSFNYWGLFRSETLGRYSGEIALGATAGLAVGATVLTAGAGAGISASLLAGVMTFVGVSNGGSRFVSGQTAWQSIRGGIYDATGASALYGGLNNQDIITGKDLGWSGGQRWLQGTLGAISLLSFGAAGVLKGAQLLRASSAEVGVFDTARGVLGLPPLHAWLFDHAHPAVDPP